MKVTISEFLEAVDSSQNGQEAATKLGVTRERVRQLCKENGTTKFRRHSAAKRICPGCGGRKHYDTGLCRACWLKAHRVQLQCAWCGKAIERKLWSIRPQNRYGYYCNMSHRSLQLHAVGAFAK